MIDKSSPRHKHENRFKVDGREHASIQRIRADIADVALHKVPLAQSSRRLVGIGKHVCGAATGNRALLDVVSLWLTFKPSLSADLALNCLHNAHKESKNVRGICIALCCHHRCTWRHYVGKAFFKVVKVTRKALYIETTVLIAQEVGLDARDFAVMRALTSWATCGARPSDEAEAEHDIAPEEEPPAGRYALLGLDAALREQIGRRCKQIIDRGRVAFLSGWPLDARLLDYVRPEVSPENALLLAS